MAVPIGPIIAFLSTVFARFGGGGHADDAVDDAEVQIIETVFRPLILAAGGRTTGQWITEDIKTIPIPSPMLPAAAGLAILDGDAVVSTACAEFVKLGYPCHGGGGAAGDIQPIWSRLRARLQLIAGTVPAAGAVPATVPGAVPSVVPAALPSGSWVYLAAAAGVGLLLVLVLKPSPARRRATRMSAYRKGRR